MGKRKVKAIIFDFDQTLVDSSKGFKMAEKSIKEKIFKDLGMSSWDEFLSDYRNIRRKFHSEGGVSRISLWRRVYSRYNKEVNMKLFEKWEKKYWDEVRSYAEPFPETMYILKKLKGSYRLALITNISGNSKVRIRDFPKVLKYFEKVVYAGESGIPPKPDRAPFITCLESLGIKAQDAVYIGDDWEIDICGAKKAGILPIWLKHEMSVRNWPDVSTDLPVFHSLYELLDISETL